MTPRRKLTPSVGRTFGIPAIIALASLIGLIAALLGDGAFDATSWLGLGIPIATIIWARLRKPH